MPLTVSFQESRAGLENTLLLWESRFTYLLIFNLQCLLRHISDVTYTQHSKWNTAPPARIIQKALIRSFSRIPGALKPHTLVHCL